MNIPRMRPSFVANAHCRAEDAITVLRERLDDNPQTVEGSFSRKNGVLQVCRENQKFWSPCLDLTVDFLLTDTSSNKLGGLGTEIKNENFFTMKIHGRSLVLKKFILIL